MIDYIVTHQNCFLFLVISFFTVFTIRTALVHKTKYVVLYHGVIFFILSILFLGGGGVQNDGYESLDEFTALETSGKLTEARAHPEKYNHRLQMDLLQFSSAHEFRKYIEVNDRGLARLDAVLMGWFLALLTEISLILIAVARRLGRKQQLKE